MKSYHQSNQPNFSYDNNSQVKVEENVQPLLEVLPQFQANDVNLSMQMKDFCTSVKLQEESVCHYITFEKELKAQNQQPSSKKKRKKSVFHNFLKHLFTTIKRIGSLQFIQNHASNYEQFQLAFKIWEKFLTTRIFTKKVMTLVFGSCYQQAKCQAKLKKFLNCTKSKSQAQIANAQQLLRKMILEGINSQEKLQKLLQNRKIKNLDYFKIYTKQFLQELASAGIKQRFPKSKRTELQKINIKQQSLN